MGTFLKCTYLLFILDWAYKCWTGCQPIPSVVVYTEESVSERARTLQCVHLVQQQDNNQFKINNSFISGQKQLVKPNQEATCSHLGLSVFFLDAYTMEEYQGTGGHPGAKPAAGP